MEEYSAKFRKLFEEAGMKAWSVEFPVVCSDENIAKIIDFSKQLPEIPDAFIGIGGGQTCDMVKAIGVYFRKAVFCCPTSLATDAPTSTHTIVNNPGKQSRLDFHYKNPDYVIVDTAVTINSPLIMYRSGLGDALATYIEAEASYAHNNINNVTGFRYKPTILAMSAAKACYDTILEKGRAAYRSAASHIRTQAYEDVSEATTLLSGLGFECTGVSIAHALQAGFVRLKKPMLHGLGVGYCTLIELLLENNIARFEEIYSFCSDVGLPVCTAELGITEEDKEESINAVLDEVYPSRWNITNEPFHVSREMLKNAILYLDAYTAEKLR